MFKFASLAVFTLAALPAFPQANTTVSTAVFHALLSPSHETPPVTGSNISGEGTIEMTLTRSATGDLTQAIVDFRVNYNAETPHDFTAMHIHRGAAGVAGPVVIDSRFGAVVNASGPGSVFRQNVLTDAAPLAVVQQILNNPGGYYLNLHSSANPAGIIRGQLTWDTEAANAVRFQASQTQLDRLEGMVRNIGRALGLIFPATQ
ncbi:MAG: CHRD domain-containing protein [Bryobacteraceae bacterium]|nr:CHRD domain-containing protein [Bryobacteraceae bacterium]